MEKRMDDFHFTINDVVLAEWNDKLFYAKILHIDRVRHTCTLLFDDKSEEDCPLSKIHSVTETTAEIVCIICKDGSSSRPNEIVLCDKCGVGYHQKCHEPFIEDNALEPEAPWMCVYCTNGSDCPYLLNPFEAKLKNFTTSSRKQRATTKDNHYSSDRKTNLGHDNRTNVRILMEDYYDGPRPRSGSETTRSRARHVLDDQRNVRRPGMVDHRRAGNPRNEFYPYSGSCESATELLHYPYVGSLSKRRSLSLQQKQRPTQDVWDNGYASTRDGVKIHEKVDAKTKASGKDGPREKQRLTQDLERQRKKLKEDMERGQELEREHSQLLTRDLPRPKSDVVMEDEKMDLETKKPERRDRRLYSRGEEWTGSVSANSLENLANSSGNTEPSNATAVTGKANEPSNVEHRDLGYNDNVPLQRSLNGAGASGLEKELSRDLDACGCDGTETEAEMSGQRGNRRKEKEDLTPGFVAEISDTQCEHSSSRIADSREGDTKMIQFVYETISSASSDNGGDLSVDLKDDSKYAESGLVEKSDCTKTRVFTSEKVEVVGRSDDLTGTGYYEVSKDRQSARGRPKKTTAQGKGGGRAQKKCHKSSSCVAKTNFDRGEDVYEEKGSFLESRTIRKTKEGSGGRLATSKADKESLRDSNGSSGLNQQSVCHNDNKVTDAQEGRPQERSRTKSHGSTHEVGVKKDHDMDSHIDITQNRVRSDLPRHNWLIERLLNEKKLVQGACAPSTGVSQDRSRNLNDDLKDSKGEMTSSLLPESSELVKAPAHSTTSPTSEDHGKDDQAQIRGDAEEERANTNSKEEGIKTRGDYDGERLRAEKDNIEQNPNNIGCKTSDLKVLSPKSETNSPPDLNHLSPELQRFSPTLVPASPCEAEETRNRPSPLLKVPNVPRDTFGDMRESPSNGDSSDDDEVREEKKNSSLNHSREAGVAATFRERQSTQDSDDNNPRIMVNEKPLNEEYGDARGERVIEIKSDGEGSEDVKECNEQCREREFSKISTGKSVNPVSPFLRTERRSVDELKPRVHGTHCYDMTPRSARMPADLPSSLQFMNPGYLASHSPRTFTPHLITHNPLSTTGMPAPVSPISRLVGNSSMPSHLPGRLELGGHSKLDLNCPYHGKKAAEKLTRHAPGYPMIPGDHPHVLSRIPLHESLPDAASLKMHDKLRDHAELATEPLGFHRPLPPVYDNHRHLVMPHGIHGHAHYPRYLGPGIMDEYSFQLDREQLKRKIEAGYALHEPPKHTFSRRTEDHRNTSKYIASPSEEHCDVSKQNASPSEENRNATRCIASPSGTGRSDSARTLTRPVLGERAGHCHADRHHDYLHPSRLSPHVAKYFKGDQSSQCDLNSSAKPRQYSPTAARPASYTPPNSAGTENHRPLYIQLGETKRLEGKSGTDTSLRRVSSPPGPPEQESITRHFQERFNILNRKFLKEMEATVNQGEGSQQKKENWLPLEGSVPGGHRRLGPEFDHRLTPSFFAGHPSDGITRPPGDVLSLSSHRPEPSKYKDYESAGSRAARNSPPTLTGGSGGDRRTHKEPESPRKTVNVSPREPTSSMPSYRAHGDVMRSMASSTAQRGLQLKDGRKKSPIIPGLTHLNSAVEHPAYYDQIPWPLTSRARIGNVLAARKDPEDNQRSPVDKIEREKAEHLASEREMQEKEISLARQKHRINLAHLEHERRMAFMSNDRTHSQLTSLNEERREERRRPDNAELVHRNLVAKEEGGSGRDWEEAGSKKRKLDEISPEVLAMHSKLSPHRRTSSDLNKKLNSMPKDDRIPAHSSSRQSVHEHFDPRKGLYLPVYGAPRGDPYGHVTSLPFSGKTTNAGNAPFYMSRFDLPRARHEQGIPETLRKQRELGEDQPQAKKLSSNEKDFSPTEPAKKRSKTPRLCDVCNKEASFLCSGCQKAWYCSPECQLKAWAEHSKECSEIKRR